jgi:Tol biopolymer transport system component
MNSRVLFFMLPIILAAGISASAGENPADHLPPQITQLLTFGERPEWSHDGRKILFMSKTFGDAMEIDLATKKIRNLTAFYPHYGYTRAMYLANDDILLAGPEMFDPKNTDYARRHCYLFVLGKSLTKPAVPLGELCSEGPAVSRKKMRIAWTQWSESSNEMPPTNSEIFEADIVYENGVPKLVNKKFIVDNHALPFPCTIETQNFCPPDENKLTFSAYNPPGTESDVCSVDLTTGKVINLTHSPNNYDEVEGISPDGQYALVECDQQNHLGPGHIDIWKLKLDGSEYKRLTFFSGFPGYKAANPVVSDDGRFFSFQAGRSGEAAGTGHGIFIYNFEKAESENATSKNH